ncbi:MAG: DMT family transporter [Clostridiales bacterium]|nr:DMT family transporter [Candidatus Blautia equi]
MIDLILAVLSSTMVALVMRISGRYTDKNRNISMLAVNYLICTLLACLYSGFGSVFTPAEGSGIALGLGSVNGLLYLLGFVLLQINTKRNGVVMSSTFIRLGVLVPTISSIVIFHEKPTVMQILGIVLALAAIIGISTDDGKNKSTLDFKAGLILMLLAGGTADAMSKVYDEYGKPELSNQFLVYTFIFALLFCVALMLYKKQTLGKPELLFGAIIAIPNYYSARFLLKAVASVPAVVAYPTYSVSTIVVTSLVGVLFFHEKINRRQGIAIAGILVALVLLNI